MDTNLPAIAKKDTVFKKMVNFIKRVFKVRKRSKIEKISRKECANKINELYKVALSNNDKIIKETNRKERLFDIIKIIEKQPEMLEDLDISKLEVIDNYYKNEISEYKKKIAKVS